MAELAVGSVQHAAGIAPIEELLLFNVQRRSRPVQGRHGARLPPQPLRLPPRPIHRLRPPLRLLTPTAAAAAPSQCRGLHDQPPRGPEDLRGLQCRPLDPPRTPRPDR